MQNMKKVCSISGGKTSAYLAANYEWDDFVFALVRTNDLNLLYKDDFLKKYAEDKIQTEFVGTLEDDAIIKTMYELEQFLGRNINWVTGITFDEVIETKGGWLPNKLHRYCTLFLKMEPIVKWWFYRYGGEPVQMGIGFRANENRRVERVLSQCNKDGLNEFEITVEKHKDGRNKWQTVAWRKPIFPLFDDRVFSDDIFNFWDGKPVTFAQYNNCVHCFHRNAYFLRAMAKIHPQKIQWAASKEGGKKGFWRDDVSYKKIIEMPLQGNLFDAIEGQCDDGFCELT